MIEEKETNKNDKKKEITCFKCKKKEHYSNQCMDELPTTTDKKGTSLLINKEDSSDEEIEDEQYGAEEENECLTSQENQSDNQEKNRYCPRR